MTCLQIIRYGKKKGDVCNRSRCRIHKSAIDRKTFKKNKYRQAIKKMAQPFSAPPFPNVRQHFYTNQAVAGEEIMNVYTYMRYCILVAQCQSGKTGVAKNVICNFVNLHLDAIPILLIPISSNDILNQAKREFQHLIHEDNILSLPQMLNTDCLADRIAANPGRAVLLIVDESHLNATIEKSANCLFNTLRNAGINGAQGILPDNCWLLSISATPNAELAGHLQNTTEANKAIVQLVPGEHYYGIKDMLTSGRVFESHRLKEDLAQKNFINDIKDRYMDMCKYGLVRLPSHASCTRFQPLLAAEGIHSVIFDSYVPTSRDIGQQVKIAPTGLTLILMVHRLRASVQVDSTYICFVHENFVKNVDTTIQGLPGRMCGYGKRAHAVDIYCNPLALMAQLRWLEDGINSVYIPSCRTIQGGFSSHDEESIAVRRCKPIEKSIYHFINPKDLSVGLSE
jgi:hypothetical protein